MKRKAKLSIVAPVYNKAAWIAETIKSLEEQSMEDIEILFIDDGSTDDTVEVIRHYQKFDKRIRLHRLRKNQGLSKAWNKGISLAKTPIILVASGDDIFHKDRAKITYNYFKNYLHIPSESINVWFSGQKGFHIRVNSRVFGLKPNYNLHIMNKLIATELKKKLNTNTMDMAIYSNRRGLRMPCSYHSGGGKRKHCSLISISLNYILK